MAGVGNVLQADDGFGVEVARILMTRSQPDGVVVTETGIGGVALVQDLMVGYDACILIDAVDRGRPPGTIMIIEPDVVDVKPMRPEQRHDLLADMHLATPSRALMVAKALGALPRLSVIVGCQPAETSVLRIGLSDIVAAAVPVAVAEVERCIAEFMASFPEDDAARETSSATASASGAIAKPER